MRTVCGALRHDLLRYGTEDVEKDFMATVVELFSITLKRESIRYIFGIPGGGATIDPLDATEKDLAGQMMVH